MTSSSQPIDNLLNSLVGFMLCSFEFAFRLVGGIGLVMETGVGELPAEVFMEEHEQERDPHALVMSR
jgi:hypothetical protein